MALVNADWGKAEDARLRVGSTPCLNVLKPLVFEQHPFCVPFKTRSVANEFPANPATKGCLRRVPNALANFARTSHPCPWFTRISHPCPPKKSWSTGSRMHLSQISLSPRRVDDDREVHSLQVVEGNPRSVGGLGRLLVPPSLPGMELRNRSIPYEKDLPKIDFREL